MTLGIAWVSKRPNGQEDLFLATDSRTHGYFTFDHAPKIIPLPRSDSAFCFAGDTVSTYPFILQISNAVLTHSPAKDRSLDLNNFKAHCLRILNDMVCSYKREVDAFKKSDATFILAGYSWKSKSFRIWTFFYDQKQSKFIYREAVNFHNKLRKAAFIGDWAKLFRSYLVREINAQPEESEIKPYLPLRILARLLSESGPSDSIGGAPQLVRIGEHMNLRPTYVMWNGKPYLFGREMYDYENTNCWGIDPFTGEIYKPRDYGERPGVD